MKKIALIGHFAYGTNNYNGQTVKTREIYNQLKKNKLYSLSINDTYNYSKKLYKFIRECFLGIKKNDYLIIIVASGGVKILIPMFVFLNLFFNKKICYCAVGSWLDLKVKENKILRIAFKKVNTIFVETNELKISMNNLGFNNVNTLYNFKEIEQTKCLTKRKDAYFCTFSRVIKEKGIEDVVYSIGKLNNEGINCKLDIYGPISKEYETEFFELIKDNKNVQYCGIIPPEKSKIYISKYYMLVFPTHFVKEGLPGTLIDAYSSSTPVISSNWLSAEEFVPNEVGYRYKFADKEELYKTMKWCLANKNDVFAKGENAYNYSKKFNPQEAILPLNNFLSD